MFGRVRTVQGLLIEVVGPVRELRVGGRVVIETAGGAELPSEIIGFRDGHALCLPFGPGCGSAAARYSGAMTARCFRPTPGWAG